MLLKEWKSLPASPLQPLQVAEEEVTVAVVQVHAVTLTVAKKEQSAHTPFSSSDDRGRAGNGVATHP